MIGIRAISSRAGTRSRLRLGTFVPGVPPRRTSAPEIYEGFWMETWTGFYWIFGVAPGMTLMAHAGDWDTTDGETTLDTRFILDDGSPTGTEIGAPGDTELPVTEEMLGHYIYYRVRATRGGVTVEELTWLEIQVINVSDRLAQFNHGTRAAYQFWKPGQAITKPSYLWIADPAFGTYTTVGEWWKNGVATGVTAATYSDTAEGDIVIWIEKIVGSFAIEAVMPDYFKTTLLSEGNWFKCVVNAKAAELVQGSDQSLSDRLVGAVGGATSMEVFSTKDPVAGIYVVNEDNWLRDLYPQLCAVAAGHHGRSDIPTGRGWQQAGGWINSYGPTLITPRHIISSGHTHFHNCNGTTRNFTVRWVLEDGTLVEAKVIGGHKYYESGGCSGNQGYGSSISLLDRDVQALGVPVMPSLSMSAVLEEVAPLWFTPSYFSRSQSAADRFGPHQLAQFESYADNWSGNNGYHPPSDYPKIHENMFWASRDGVQYHVWGGDSGTPMMVVINDTVFLHSILSGGSVSVDSAIDQLDAMILEADTLAVQRNLIPAPTGYTITRCYDHANPNLLLISQEDPTAILISEADPTPLFALPN